MVLYTIGYRCMDIKEENVLKLIADVQSGDRSAFSALLSMYRPLLYARIARFSPSDTEREELYQDASLALYRAALCYRSDAGASFGAFARVCVDNALISAYRKASADRGVFSLDAMRESGDEPLLHDGELADPSLSLIEREEASGLYRMALSCLSAYELRVFLSYIRGYSAHEIAPAVGRSEKSVANAIGRALAKLRAQLR